MKSAYGAVSILAILVLVCCSGKNSQNDTGTDTSDDVTADTLDDPSDDTASDEGDVMDDTPTDAPDGGCESGTGRCVDGSYSECFDGAWGPPDLCEAHGMLCDEDLGCVLTCDAVEGLRTTVGCEFWAVDLDNVENPFDAAAGGQFAVAVVNQTLEDAVVTVYRDVAGIHEPRIETAVETVTLGAAATAVIALDRLDVDGPSVTDGDDDGPQSGISKRSYRIESTGPVLAYQFNPYEDQYANDATLLLPTSSLSTSHHVVSWTPAYPYVITGVVETPNRGYVTVVGTEDSTTVQVTASCDLSASVGTLPEGYDAVDAMDASTTRSFDLNRYQVLNLETRENASPGDPAPDISGTTVTSDHPVAVFTGVDMVIVPGEDPPSCTSGDCTCCGDHVEMQVLPDEAGGKKYFVAHSARRSTGGWLESDTYRVLGLHGGTTVVTSLASTPSFTLDASETMTFQAQEGFTLQADQPVMLVRILASKEKTVDEVGDPAMTLVPDVSQWRSLTTFVTALDLTLNQVVISMPTGSSVSIDGSDVASTCSASGETLDLDGTSYTSYTCTVMLDHMTVEGYGTPVGVDYYGYSDSTAVAYAASFDPVVVP